MKRFRYKVYSVKKATSNEQLDALVNLQKKMPELDFWSDPSLTRSTDILVSPQEVPLVEGYLQANEFQYDVPIQDVQR